MPPNQRPPFPNQGMAQRPNPPRPSFLKTAFLSRSPMAIRESSKPSSAPLMAPMFWACGDLFGIAANVKSGQIPFTSAVDLRNVIDRELAMMTERARTGGVLTDDILEAQYAIIALLDEVLVRAPWPGQGEWRIKPLQLLRFNENTAGETFFRRLATLEGQPHRVHVLQVYYLCLAAGFQGRYAFTQHDALGPLYDRVGSRVAEACGSDAISPHGEPDGKAPLLKAEAPLVKLGLGFFVFAIVLIGVLRAVLSWEVRNATKPMNDYAASTLPKDAK